MNFDTMNEKEREDIIRRASTDDKYYEELKTEMNRTKKKIDEDIKATIAHAEKNVPQQ